MMKLNKKIMTGTLAAAVLIGGGIVGLNQIPANAAGTLVPTTTDTVAKQSTDGTAKPNDGGNRGGRGGFEGGKGGRGGDRGHGGGGKGGVKLDDAAAVIGVEESALRTELQAGKTLVEIAAGKGITEAVLIQKLVAAKTLKIDAEVTAGTITAAEATEKKAKLTEKVTEDIARTGLGQGGDRGKGGRQAVGTPAELAAVIGITEAELKTQQDAGKTLVEIAAAKGITQAVLTSKLTAAATAKIDAQVTAGTLTAAQATEKKAALAEKITEAITSTHLGRGPGRDGLGVFGSKAELAAIIGITEAELETQLAAGKTLVEIAATKNITESQLIAKLKDGLNDQLTEFVQRKHTGPVKEAAETAAPAAASTTTT